MLLIPAAEVAVVLAMLAVKHQAKDDQRHSSLPAVLLMGKSQRVGVEPKGEAEVLDWRVRAMVHGFEAVVVPQRVEEVVVVALEAHDWMVEVVPKAVSVVQSQRAFCLQVAVSVASFQAKEA